MRLEIENTLGIEKAAIELTPGGILEVVGPNASGKTSLATCAQAVLAREANPLGLSAADAKRSYPHDGAEDARVEVDGIEFDGIDWPPVAWYPQRGTISTASIDYLSHPEAVGLIDFTAKRGAKERAAVFQNALLPPPETVLAKVQETLAGYLPEADLVGVMQMLEERGWEATASVYEERGRQAKREWRDITNRNYGVKVASDWRPDGWLADYDLKTVQEAEAAVTDARDALNAMHRVQAVSETDAQRAKDAADALPGLRARVEELEQARSAKVEERDKIPLGQAAQKAREAEQALDEARRELSERQTCPHCGNGVAIRRNKVVQAEDEDHLNTSIRELEIAHADALNVQADLQDRDAPLTKDVNQLMADLHLAQNELRAAEKDAGGPAEAQSQSEADRVALAQAEQAVEDARVVVQLVRAEADAARLHETIVRYTDIARALGPEGVRAKMLEDGLRKLNGGLKTIAKESGWPLTAVADNGGITMGDRPVAMCSESERWRAGAAIQLTLGAITGSKAVVLDRGDLLDATNRQGLVRAVERVAGRTGMAVLLCSTADGNELPAPWPQVEIRDGRTE